MSKLGDIKATQPRARAIFDPVQRRLQHGCWQVHTATGIATTISALNLPDREQTDSVVNRYLASNGAFCKLDRSRSDAGSEGGVIDACCQRHRREAERIDTRQGVQLTVISTPGVDTATSRVKGDKPAIHMGNRRFMSSETYCLGGARQRANRSS